MKTTKHLDSIERITLLKTVILDSTASELAEAVDDLVNRKITAKDLVKVLYEGKLSDKVIAMDWMWKSSALREMLAFSDFVINETKIGEKAKENIIGLVSKPTHLEELCEIGFLKGISPNTALIVNCINEYISEANMEMLASAEKCSLIHPRRIDAYIELATESGHSAVVAFLLEWKNNNIDIAAEERKAEERMRRQLNASPESLSEQSKIWSFDKLEADKLRVFKYKGTSNHIVIPEKIGKVKQKTVSEIGRKGSRNAIINSDKYYNSKDWLDVTHVTLPETIEIIWDCAFRYCDKLKSINLPEGLRLISKEAFSGCSELKEIVLPKSLKRIERYAFSSCKNLEKVVFLNRNTQIGESDDRWYERTIFECSESVTFFGCNGSTAQRHANKYNLKFKLLEENNSDN